MLKPKVAILGLGIMGSGMARRLVGAGFPVTVYNRNRVKCEPFVREGAIAAVTPREAASHSQIILSMVADDEASRHVWLGEDGALAGAARDSLLIECSTLTAGWIQELASLATKHGCRVLDAPVTGTKPHAESGELVFLVGGSLEAVAAAQPVFAVLGRETIHLGPTGSGALMKLTNNFLCGVQAASLAEALRFIEASGLDRAKALSILTAGAPGSGIVKRVADRVQANEFTPNFALRWMAKDLSYALQEASTRKVPLQTVSAAVGVFQRAIDEGHGDEDFSAVSKVSTS
ncbi:MAG TPA: NAD(P)-dependent oxidoreductase [Candidatus Acidoferrales bacterium]|nr:NAD(P)-dependent oxidoreductase [Candidatus Acidoferrales bacterium]